MTTTNIIDLIQASLPVGYTGSLGYTGSGAYGYSGSVGYTGSASNVIGYSGSLGYTGSAGYAGSQGIAGYTGSLGAQGYAGSQGYTGSAGYTGSQGNKGGVRYYFDNTTSAGVTPAIPPSITPFPCEKEDNNSPAIIIDVVPAISPIVRTTGKRPESSRI